MFPTPDSYVGILMSNEMVGGETFGSCLGHEGGALIFMISALTKEAPESFLAPSTI